MQMLKLGFAFLAAVVATTALATAASTQFVLAALSGLGVEISLGTRLSMTLHDIAGMGPLYGSLLLVSFAIALPVAALVTRYLLPGWRPIGYPLAGAAAVLVLLLLMEAVLEIMPVAGARSITGLLVQIATGAAGGYLFVRLAPAAP